MADAASVIRRGAAHSVKLEGGDVEPARHAQVAQVAVAQPVGKGQLVPVWQLHLKYVTLKGHSELQWEGRCQGVRRHLEMGQSSARWLRPCQHVSGPVFPLCSLFDIILRPLSPLTSPGPLTLGRSICDLPFAPAPTGCHPMTCRRWWIH